MRIVSGHMRGRQVQSPGSRRTHPMSEKMRAAIFNILGDIEDMTVLDAFAGSGALAFEAISRGAKHAVLVERDKAAQKAILETVANLKQEEQVQLYKANISTWSSNNKERVFDLIFCDPPYDNFRRDLLQKLVRHLDTNGTYIISFTGTIDDVPTFEGMKLASHKTYGSSQLAFYKKTG